MPTHASRDAVSSEGTATGRPLTRRRFLTYVVAAPVLTVAASSAAGLMVPRKAYADTATAWQARHNLSGADFQGAFDLLKAQGFRPIDVNGASASGVERFSGIWEKSPGPPTQVRHGITAAAHQQLFATLPAQGFRPIAVSGHDTPGGIRFSSIWQAIPSPEVRARHGLTPAEWQSQVGTLPNEGFRPVDLCGYTEAGQVRFASIWERTTTPEWVARHGMTAGQYQQQFDHWATHGFVLRRVSGYMDGGQTRYAALWSRGPALTWQARHGLDAAQHQAEFNVLADRGYRLVKVNGYPEGGTVHYASIWHKPYLSDRDETTIRQAVQNFMTAHNVRGVSLAMTRNGALMFARGFGTTDGAGTPVLPSHLFRIASISKPITSIAVFRAIEAGLLALTDRVFGQGGILGNQFGTPPYPDQRVTQITVQHLLEHTSGWSNAQDPMFGQPNATHADLIGQMLGSTLATNPGAICDYLNFGYCVLGRALEQVSGLSFADFVRQRVLAPCGVTDMHIAGDTFAERRPNEVIYQQDTISPYSLPVARMDAHGGWIANPTDLLRIALRFDGLPSRPDLLQSNSIATMTTATTAPNPAGKPADYAKGWAVNSARNWWHHGDFPGSMGELLRTPDGFCWAILANTRDEARIEDMKKAIDAVGWTIKKGITVWPAGDAI
jgi:CubicO group peptidase (beta-lactamase class C family)